MIQRIQTLYLLVVAILMVLMMTMPIIGIVQAGELFLYNAFGAVGDNALKAPEIVDFHYFSVVVAVAITIPLVAIFFFKNRKMQIKLAITEIVVLVLLQVYVAVIWYMAYSSKSLVMDGNVWHYVASGLPLVAIIFTWLALRGIRKDDKLVRSQDRLR